MLGKFCLHRRFFRKVPLKFTKNAENAIQIVKFKNIPGKFCHEIVNNIHPCDLPYHTSRRKTISFVFICFIQKLSKLTFKYILPCSTYQHVKKHHGYPCPSYRCHLISTSNIDFQALLQTQIQLKSNDYNSSSYTSYHHILVEICFKGLSHLI